MKSILKEDISSESDKLIPELEDTFLNKKDVKIFLIEKDDILWRFISQRNKPKFSAFWIDGETMASLMSIFRSWDDYKESTKKKVIRDNLGIINDWSQLSWRVKMKFVKPVVAYYGIVSPQKFLDKDIKIESSFGALTPYTEYRVGGFQQYVIPSLHKVKDSKGEEIASVDHFVHI